MTASRRIPASAASAVLLLLLSLGAARVYAAGEQAEQFTSEFRQMHTSYAQKHTPKIVAQGAFISTVTRAGCWSPTVTLAGTAPRRSCQTCSLYWPGGRLSKLNCPSAPVMA